MPRWGYPLDSGAPYLLCEQAMMCLDRDRPPGGVEKEMKRIRERRGGAMRASDREEGADLRRSRGSGVSHRADPGAPGPERLDSLRTLQVAFT